MVLDFDTQKPLAGVTVSIPAAHKGTTTDDQGMFSFLLDVDNYIIVFSAIEYRSLSQPVYILDKNFITVELKKRLPSELPEVIVEIRRKDANVSDVKMSTININLAQLRKTPLVFGEADILKALTLQTGITTIGEGAGGFSVRGGNADQNLVLIDGAPLFNTSHLLGFYSTISPESVQDFTLYKGAIPASFGGRLSSLISTQAELDALNVVAKADARQSAAHPALGEVEQLVIRYAAQMTLDVKVTDEVFNALRRHFDTTHVVELTSAIAPYNMVARFLVALGVSPEA